MIFVTVGTQLPFDRLICAADGWAAAHPGTPMFAQIGPGATRPEHIPCEVFLPPARADALMREADLIVAHAGMGTVLSALSLRKPIVVLPRRGVLSEHRNDHQMATARWLQGRSGISVAWEAEDLARLLDARDELIGGEAISPYASGSLVDRLAGVVAHALAPSR